MNNNSDHIKEKIKKLLALSESSNPSEAAIALSRAQKLMQEHNISMSQIKLSNIVKEECTFAKGIKSKHVALQLARLIRNAFGVSTIFTVKNSSTIQGVTFYGIKERMDAAVYTFTILQRQVEIVKKQYSKKLRKELVTSHLTKDINKTITRFKRLAKDALEEYEIYEIPESLANKIFRAKEDIDKAKNRLKREKDKLIKIYLEGWLRSVNEKVVAFALSREEQLLLEEYESMEWSNLSSIKSKARTYSQSQINSYREGMNDGKNFNLYHGVNGVGSAKLGFKD